MTGDTVASTVMTSKDWIQLIVPILANLVIDGLLLEIFRRRMERSQKLEDLSLNARTAFIELLQKAHDTAADCVIAMQNGTGTSQMVDGLAEQVQAVVKFYSSHAYELNVFSENFDAILERWNDFAQTVEAFQHGNASAEPDKALFDFRQNLENTIKEMRRNLGKALKG